MSEQKNDTAVDSGQNIISINLQQYTPASFDEANDTKGFLKYGDNNLFPQYIGGLMDGAPVHGSLCQRIGRRIGGKGITGPLPVSQTQAELDLVAQKAGADIKSYGGIYIDVRYSKEGGKIARLDHIPFEQCRLGKPSDAGKVSKVWFSQNWAKTGDRKNRCVAFPAFNKLMAGKPGHERQIYFKFINVRGSNLYGKPDYFSAINWAELERQIGMFDVNEIMNGFFPSVFINMFNGQLDPKARDEKVKHIQNRLTGAKNNQRIVIQFNEKDAQPMTADVFEPNQVHKRYEQKVNQARDMLLVAHGVTSPLLFGIRDTGGGLGSNSAEMKEADRLFTVDTIEPMQRVLCDAFEEIMTVNVASPKYTVIPYTPMEAVAASPDGTAAAAAEDVASQALNGAQIASLIDILIQASTGVIPVESSKAVMKASFPSLTDQQIEDIFSGIVSGSVTPAEITQAALSKAVVLLSNANRAMTAEIEAVILSHLDSVGEVVDDEEWELISEARCYEDHTSEQMMQAALMAVTLSNEGSYANDQDKSKWGDSGLYKLRYSYSQNVTEDSRQFCKRMVALSLAGKVFRYEDIKAMGEDGVNGQFAPAGQSTYDIFTWKGGVYCHHFWKRQIYFRKTKGGKFLPNDGLKNDIRVANVPFVPQKGAEGVAPIDTPTRGSLKN